MHYFEMHDPPEYHLTPNLSRKTRGENREDLILTKVDQET